MIQTNIWFDRLPIYAPTMWPAHQSMKFKHKGRGYCRYEGEFQNGVFHGPLWSVSIWRGFMHGSIYCISLIAPSIGHGTYTCIDGREYVGNWCHGRRSGEGTMVLCPVSERGDHNRRYIGGLNGLYRPLKYTRRRGTSGTTATSGPAGNGTAFPSRAHALL